MRRHHRFLSLTLVTLALAAGGLGCANRSNDDFTPIGKLAAEGEGPLTYVAPSDGTIYVYDGTGDRLVFAGPIKAGQTFSVEPRAKRLMIDGRVIQEGALDTGKRHQIYLDTPEDAEARMSSSSFNDATVGDQADRVYIERGPRRTEYRAVDPE